MLRDSRIKDWCTALTWSADIGISWRGGSTKHRKPVAIGTPFYVHLMASRATGFASGARAGRLLFFVRD